jgi:hypothetical protein
MSGICYLRAKIQKQQKFGIKRMNSKMDPMGRAIADYWNARSSESRQARLDGRVVTSKDEVKTDAVQGHHRRTL